MSQKVRRLLAVVVLCVSSGGALATTHSPLMHSAGIECGGGGLARPAHIGGVVIDGWGPVHGGCS